MISSSTVNFSKKVIFRFQSLSYKVRAKAQIMRAIFEEQRADATAL